MKIRNSKSEIRNKFEIRNSNVPDPIQKDGDATNSVSVAQIFNLLYRRFSICEAEQFSGACRIQFGDTAEYNSALPGYRAGLGVPDRIQKGGDAEDGVPTGTPLC